MASSVLDARYLSPRSLNTYEAHENCGLESRIANRKCRIANLECRISNVECRIANGESRIEYCGRRLPLPQIGFVAKPRVALWQTWDTPSIRANRNAVAPLGRRLRATRLRFAIAGSQPRCGWSPMDELTQGSQSATLGFATKPLRGKRTCGCATRNARPTATRLVVALRVKGSQSATLALRRNRVAVRTVTQFSSANPESQFAIRYGQFAILILSNLSQHTSIRPSFSLSPSAKDISWNNRSTLSLPRTVRHLKRFIRRQV
jgi:hypothetical protein